MEESNRPLGFFCRNVQSSEEMGAKTRGGRRKSVRTTLFSSYVLLVLLSTIFVTVFSYFYTSNMLRRVAFETLTDISSKVVDALDAELSKMNAVSLAVSSSDLVKQLVRQRGDIQRSAAGTGQRLSSYRNAVQIVEVMQTIIGPYKPVPQVNLYDFQGGMIGAGAYSQAAQRSVHEVPWLDSADKRSGAKRFTLPHDDPLLGKAIPAYAGRSCISLYRMIYSEYPTALGVLEVEQFTATLFRGSSSTSSRVAVFTSDGTRLFPADQGPGQYSAATLDAALEASRDGEFFTLRDPGTGHAEIATIATSGQSGWRVVVSQEQRLLNAPVRDFTAIILLFGLVLLAAAVLIASRLSTRLTVPLARIHDAIVGLDWERVSQETAPRPQSDLNELEELELAFSGMTATLRKSMHDALDARAHELQANMLALQSQMDPHFVYNMLTTIAIMAEEGMTADITRTVEDLTRLLRYISSGSASVVTVAEEVEYARRYLACMKTRFRDGLAFDISVDPDLRDVPVPKLVIQPLIENAMKYGISRQPPWHISIRGKIDGRKWKICVGDDGPGFPEARLRSLREEVASRMGSTPDARLSISGMGLLNTASRLRIFYGDDAVCTLENAPGGGAVVTIGGNREPGASLLRPGG